MRLYRCLKSITEGQGNTSTHGHHVGVDSTTNSKEGGEAILAGMQKAHSRMATCLGIADEDDDDTETGKVKKEKREKREKVEDPMKAVKTELNSVNNRIMTLKTSSNKLQQSSLRQDVHLCEAFKEYVQSWESFQRRLTEGMVTGNPETANPIMHQVKEDIAQAMKPGGDLHSLDDDLRLALGRIKKLGLGKSG